MQKVLITGADGFVGAHLIRELEENTDWLLFGIGLKPGVGVEAKRLSYEVIDITDCREVERALAACKPDAIFHLAAQPSVGLSWSDPMKTYDVNFMGQLNLFESVRKIGIPCSIHVACSSEEYGVISPEDLPITEDNPLAPPSHYAVSKASQELLALMYYRAFGWRVVITRGFNQAGPGQSPDFAISSFARQIAMTEQGITKPVIKVGNLDAKRDFTDVRDTVRAYRLIMEKASPGSIYNVCSGHAWAMSEILEKLLSMSEASIVVRKDPSRQRPSDIPVVLGDNSRLREELGWKPEIPIEKTLADTLDYWREAVTLEG
ncbi:MAG: GDP-mannose 4,6-dehydratase [Actinomycetota bacterium]|nr:GDP-mannose 4,6-dehydratase [Actinomycetota bacterium]